MATYLDYLTNDRAIAALGLPSCPAEPNDQCLHFGTGSRTLLRPEDPSP
jgi:hypothetical protein